MPAIAERAIISEREPNRETLSEFRYARAFDAPLGLISPELLGGKGYYLAWLTQHGFPVPPGFTLYTTLCRKVNERSQLPEAVWSEVKRQVTDLEEKTGRVFGVDLFLAARSGGKEKMPGMMKTVLNLGLTEENCPILTERIGEDFAHQSYQELYESFRASGKELPQDPWEQLKTAIELVFDSWNNPGAVEFRRIARIPDEPGTAVNVQEMVYPNSQAKQSGIGVGTTRHPLTGEGGIYGHYLPGGQGPMVVTPKRRLPEIKPEVIAKLWNDAQDLEEKLGFPVEFEFALENGTVSLLQIREAQLTPPGAIRTAMEMTEEGIITQEEALTRIKPHLSYFFRDTFSPEVLGKAQENGRLLFMGTCASVGDVSGPSVFSLEEAEEILTKDAEVNPILFCSFLDLDHVGIFPFRGLAVSKGSSSSHVAILMRELGIPMIIADFEILPGGQIRSHGKVIRKGEIVSLSGTTGEVFSGEIPLTSRPEVPPWLAEFLAQKEVTKKSPWRQFADSEESLMKKWFEARTIVPWVERFESSKAQTTEIITEMIPLEAQIPNVVIEADKPEAIRVAMEKVLEEGYETYPRSCSPGKVGTPYSICRTGEDIERFLADLATWREEDPSIEAVTVPKEPPGKLDPDLAHEHYAFTISCEDGTIVVNLNSGSPLLRDMNRVEPGGLIKITAQLNPEVPSRLGEIKIDYGKYQGDRTAQEVAEKVKMTIFQEWWQWGLPSVMAAMEEVFQISVLEAQGRTGKNGWGPLIYGAKGREEKELAESFRETAS